MRPINNSLLVLLLFWLLFWLPSAAAGETLTVLLTGFEPFAGRAENLSYEVAKATKESLEKTFRTGIRVELCRLPVVYDKGAKAALDCYERMNPKPSHVIAMGEGTCNIRLEGRAHNLDNTPGFKDNDGIVRVLQKIEPEGEPNIDLDPMVARMYCSSTKKERSEFAVSASPGNFVCNNVAYRLAKYFKNKEVKFGFIHVPYKGCSNENPVKNGATIARMLASVLQQPRNSDSTCIIEFFEKLKKRL